MEEKQQRVSKYETMQISSMLIPFPGGSGSPPSGEGGESEGGPSMMCVARRVPTNDNLANFAAQFTTKLDRNGVILSLDTSGITYGSCPGLGRVSAHPFLKGPMTLWISKIWTWRMRSALNYAWRMRRVKLGAIF